MKVLTAQQTLDKIEGKFQKGKRFAYVRFGDGDLQMMNGKEGKETNQWNSPALRRELISCFQTQHPDFLIGQTAGMENEKDDILWEADNYQGLFVKYPTGPSNDFRMREISDKYSKREKYVSPVAFHYFAVYHPERFARFVKEHIAEKRVLFVGGEHLKRPALEKFFGIDQFIETPTTQAYSKIEDFYPRTLEESKKFDICLLAVGHTSRAVQKRLWEEGNITCLGIGSLADAIVGFESRGWIKPAKDNIEKLLWQSK